MHRRLWLLWLAVGLVALVVLSAGMGVWALRRWPERVVPKLSPSIAVMVAGVAGERGREAIGDRLRMPDAEALVVARLSGSRRQQVDMCDLLLNYGNADTEWSERIEEALYVLANESEIELRTAARSLLSRSVNRGLNWLARQVHAQQWPEQTQPMTPEGWIPGANASKALALLAFLGAGYDHKMPSKFKPSVVSLVADLEAAQSADGHWSADGRENALIILALAEAYAMSNDPELKTILLRAGESLRHDWPPEGIERMWMTDTTLAMMQLMAWKSLAAGGCEIGDAMEQLATGFDTAWKAAGTDPLRFPWYAAGHLVAVADGESLGAAQMAAVYLGRHQVSAQIPLPRLDHPGDVRTMMGHWWMMGVFQRDDGNGLLESRQQAIRSAQVFHWHADDDGSWDPLPSVGDRFQSSVFSILAQEFYRRRPLVIQHLPSP